MKYLTLNEKISKLLESVEKKSWISKAELGYAVQSLLTDYLAQEKLRMFQVTDSSIEMIFTDYPSNSECFFTYSYDFKSDKRKSDDVSDYLLHIKIVPAIDESFWTMELDDITCHFNQIAGLIENQRVLQQEKNILLEKIKKIDCELKVLKVKLNKKGVSD